MIQFTLNTIVTIKVQYAYLASSVRATIPVAIGAAYDVPSTPSLLHPDGVVVVVYNTGINLEFKSNEKFQLFRNFTERK